MSGYIGNIPVPQATQTRQSFTATASQTTFNTAGYTAGFVDVYMNGIHLVDGTDFTATNGSTVVLTSGAASGDIVEVVMHTPVAQSSERGGGLYKGERGTLGPAAAAGDIFRVHEQQLDTNTTIASGDNAGAFFSLTVASGVTLTVNGNLVIA